MFKLDNYHFSTSLSEDDIETLEQIYEDGKEEGYDDGFDNGEAESEQYIKNQQTEWIEEGHNNSVSNFLREIGYANLIRLQEKTQYHICFGSDVNVEAMVKAIKVLIEK